MNTLNIQAEPTFSMDVEINTRAIQGVIEVDFVAKRTSELKGIEQRVQQDGSGVAGFLKSVVVGVGTVELPDGPLAIDVSKAIDQLTDWPGIGVAIQKAYYRGLWEEQAKN